MKKHKIQKVINIKNLNEELEMIRRESRISLKISSRLVPEDLRNYLTLLDEAHPQYYAYPYPETAIIELAQVRHISFSYEVREIGRET